MQDNDTRLNAVIFRSSQGHCADGALLLVVIDPATDMLVNERAHLGWPGLGARTRAFAFVQGDDELGAVAAADIKDPSFPRAEGGYGGGA
jgi:hypothetical protein